MLQKWKHIINNWINCYFDEGNQDDREINADTLLNIISHLRDNLNLDASKSSVLEAHTIKEFILEKYPCFKLGNGTIDVASEDDIYLVASLLLFFVCVNSKDVDIKSAMCSKLSVDDQEIILKFSKNLLECSSITCRDLQTAITDACGQEMATIDTGHPIVAETPPALRSLHGEVRRLQAALDAERFDRNYLQDELTRTNSRLEKLLKDKEQHKLDIMNLKAKLSECCGGDHEARAAQAGADDSAKLARQLQDMEERLVKTNELLDDAVYERDALKAKVDELKQDRDKWLTLSQTEAARTVQLSEELETERRHMQSLRELVTELRQHNRRNGLDCSQLECDDPDASISLTHNLSVCSEACANVVEVQLGEERARVSALLLQIETLQRENEQLHSTIEDENSNHEVILKEKDCTIDNLEKQLTEQTALLESLRKEHEHVILSLEKYKLETRELMSDSEMKIQWLTENMTSLKQSYDVLENAKQDTMNKRKQLIEQMSGLERSFNKLVADNNTLLNEKAILAQQLADEKSLRQITEEQKKTLATQNATNEKKFTKQQKHLEKKMAKEASKFQALVQETELLGQQLKEMKSLIETSKKEKTLLEESINEFRNTKDELCKRVDQLIEKQDILEQQYIDKRGENETLTQENEQLIQSLTEEMASRSVLLKETEIIVNQNESLKHDLLEKKSVEEALISDKELLLAEKDKVAESLQVEKAARDEVESEKKGLILKMKELNEQFTSLVESKQTELARVNECVKNLEIRCEGLSKQTETYTIQLNAKLESMQLIVQKNQSETDDLKQKKEELEDEICLLKEKLLHTEQSFEEATKTYGLQISKLQTESEHLQQVIHKNNIELTKQTEIHNAELDAKLVEIQSIQQKNETLTNTLKDVKVQLESEIHSLKENLLCNEESAEEIKKDYESQITELQTETKRLQQLIDETKIELTKQSETHTSELDTKVSEIQLIQQENQTLTKELNDVKVKLRTEINTLEEELLQNEKLTNEIKKSYEYQINEVQAETQRLQQVINENNIELSKQNEAHTTALEAKLSAIQTITNDFNKVKVQLESEIDSLKEEQIQNEQSIFEMTQSYEKQVAELQAESERLQAVITETNTELTKQTEIHNAELDAKLVEIQSIQQKNETLTNTLNDVKVQLESEIHSLKENLLCNEESAEEIKKDYESQITELQTETKRLQQLIDDTKIELTKQSETHTSELDTKVSEIQLIQQENQTLTKELNDVKVKLRTEINTLEEELLQNEKLTNEIKKSYEYQINEVQAETQRLQQVINENNIELSKQNEAHTTALEAKLSAIQTITNDFNKVKVQLESEIDSLKEEQIHNEQSIFEMTQSYEKQVAELQAESERLQAVITETNAGQEEFHTKISSVLNTALERFVEDLQKTSVANEIVLKLKEMKPDISVPEKCDLLINVANALFSEVITTKESLKRDNAALNKFKEVLEQKEALLTEKQNESERLQLVVDETINGQEDLNKQISTILNTGLNQVLLDLQKENIMIDEVEKLTNTQSDISIIRQCDLLIKTVHLLIDQVIMKTQTLEQNNTVLAELNNSVNRKETLIAELQSETYRLQQAVHEIKIELSKQRETFTTALDTKLKEMQTIQKENQSLTTDLTDVKVQLDVKVHSLKEKLVDNENVTDKLKQSYECQIDNLNLMVTKLTNYLKDKTVEIETMRKENQRLQQVINENNQALKTLEEEIKSENQNQEKLINDFESERQVLKNMVTVTESVMEDQKIVLNNTILEHIKDEETWQEENNKIKEEYETKVKEYELKIVEKDRSLQSLLKDMAELQRAKEKIEKEINVQKGSLDEEIISLKEEIRKRQDEIKDLKEDNEKLEATLEDYKKNITSLQKENDEWKVKMDVNEVECRSKVDKLTESLNEKVEKNEELNEAVKEMETERTQLETKISALEQEHDKLIKEKDAYLARLNEIQDTSVTNLTKYTEEIGWLKEENMVLSNQLHELNKDKTQLAEELCNLKQNHTELLEELNKLKQDNTELSEKNNKLKQDSTELSEEFNKLKKDNIELVEACCKSNEENKTFTDELDVLKTVKAELEEQLNKLNKIKSELEVELNKLIKDNVELTNDLSVLKKNNNELVEESSQFTKNAKELAEENTKLKEDNTALFTKINVLKAGKTELTDKITILMDEKSKLVEDITKLKDDNASLFTKITELENVKTKLSVDIGNLEKGKTQVHTENAKLALELDKFEKDNAELSIKIEELRNNNAKLSAEICELTSNNTALSIKINALENNQTESAHKIGKLEMDNSEFIKTIEEKKSVITNLESALKDEQEAQKKLVENNATEKQGLVNKCDILQTYHVKAEKELEERQKEILSLQREVQTLQRTVELREQESKAKDGIVSKMSKEKDAVINNLNKELVEEKASKDKRQSELEEKVATIMALKENLDKLNNEREALHILKKENEELIKAVGQRETFAARSQENTASYKYHSGPLAERELRDAHHQVDNTSDLTHSSLESLKTISDLERIIQDKNRTITTLQSDVTYLKTLMAESENKLLDVNKELEVSKENCHQLSMQLKKIVHQKNEEMADLKKQVNKMSATENRASQIIKVSAKYQAIILKRIAEIKNNTVLKELTNFGNSNSDSELRRSLTAGSITMEDLENFLETTERHIKKCSDKQLILQKERDRLTEVNRINESEIINLKKFLTELSVSFQTFSSVKDLYAQKLSRVISVQRTVRREILSLDGHITDAAMLKLERGYAAAMQDLSECAMNLERWVERCISRTISSEKIKQAFMNDTERASLAPSTVQNAGLEVQFDELDISFQKLLEEVSRAARGEGARDAQAVTVMEVRAEYEDKLNRMKAKMKQLYTEQIAVFKEKQREEIAALERELSKARDKLASTSRAYEEHIRGLTTELWSVGEKFLRQKDEAEWLRRKQRSGSLMSLQHVHSSGLVPMQEEGRPSDTYSLRSLPGKNIPPKQEGRFLHMSDEEDEVFDNRYLKELTATPRRESIVPPGQRLSELRWRNSLCPPHLKSSYPAETQFAQTIDEDEIKANAASRPQRKEVGITAYKKPGPPTPSKQAGRLSATDSELRESLRVEMEPQPSRKTSTPSRIRSLFRSSKNDTAEGTPRSRRLSNIFKKK